MVNVKHVSKKYGTKRVIDNISLEIPKGQIISFIGPNGAGKSTLLRLISRLITADEGRILIDGQDLSQAKDRDIAKKISILKQSNSINLRLTVRELVSFGRFPYSQGNLSKEDWEKVDEAIDYLSLKEIEGKYLDQLSGGQRQRAFIAMVIAQDTEYILLDEPLNNLDMKHSVQIMGILRRLVSDLGKTVLIVIHDINFASVYSDYIVALKDGKLIHHGPTEEMMKPAILKEVFDMEMQIEYIRDCKFCFYYK